MSKQRKRIANVRFTDQFIHGVIFDWDRIDNDSYLKKIEAFKGVEKLDSNKAITSFWEKMAAVNIVNANIPICKRRSTVSYSYPMRMIAV